MLNKNMIYNMIQNEYAEYYMQWKGKIWRIWYAIEGQGLTKEATGNESRAGSLNFIQGPTVAYKLQYVQREEQNVFLSQNIALLKNFGIRNKSLARDFQISSNCK